MVRIWKVCVSSISLGRRPGRAVGPRPAPSQRAPRRQQRAMVGRLRLEDSPAAGLSDETRAAVQALLESRFPSCGSVFRGEAGTGGTGLINRLLTAGSQIHCHNLGCDRSVHKDHCLRVVRIVEEESVVAACILLHLPAPRRQSSDWNYSEAILLAVDSAQEVRATADGMRDASARCVLTPHALDSCSASTVASVG